VRSAAVILGLASLVAPSFAQNHPQSTAPHVTHPVARPAYNAYVRSWHTPVADRTAPTDDAGRTKLALVALNTQERLELPALGANGGFLPRDLDRAAHLLREPSSGNEHPIEPRVLDAIYRIQTHFTAQEIRVISGYRTPAAIASSRGSQHGRGRAIDIVVPGASDDDVAKFAREMGYMGVGVYPVSGFVHVDVRDRSYFWVDSSGPGGRNRERGILADVATRADREAAARGEKGLPPALVGADVDALLGGRATPAAPVQEEDED
jgi:uncharacterized protein YcbK (DUF882 family)